VPQPIPPALPPGMPPPLDRTLILPVSKGLSRIRSPCAVGFTALTMCAMAWIDIPY